MASDPPRTRRSRDLRFTKVGLYYIAMAFFLAMAALNTNSNLLFAVFGLMIGVFLFAGVLGKRVLSKLTVHRVLPDHAVAGVPVTLRYQFRNDKRLWPCFSVFVEELDDVSSFARPPTGYLLQVPAASEATVAVDATPRRRGLQRLNRYRLSTSFPFGFVRRSVKDGQPDKLLVYPAIGEVDPAVMEYCRAADSSGAQMRPRPGGQEEFYGVREHRPGDNPRNIYWKRSARTASTGTLVSREMTQVAPPRLLVMVDTWLVDRDPTTLAGVERSVAMAASMVDAAIEADLSVGLVAWSNGWKRIEPSRGKRHRNDLLSLLARLPQNVMADTSRLIDHARRHLKPGMTGMLFTPRDLPLDAELGRRRNPILVLSAEGEKGKAWFTFRPTVDFSLGPVVEPAAGNKPARRGASPS